MQQVALTLALAVVFSSSALAAPRKKEKADAGSPPPDAGLLFEPFVWDIPDILEVVDVQGPMVSAGIPIRASAVRTKAKGEALVMHIFDSFKRHGLFIPVPETMSQIDTLPQITGYDTIRQIGYTAMFQANPDGTTTLILTEANIGARRGSVVEREKIPLPRDASRIMRSSLEGVDTVSFFTAMDPGAIGQFYAAFAQDAGMTAGGSAMATSFSFGGPVGELAVSAESRGDAGVHVTVINRRGTDAFRPPPGQ